MPRREAGWVRGSDAICRTDHGRRPRNAEPQAAEQLLLRLRVLATLWRARERSVRSDASTRAQRKRSQNSRSSGVLKAYAIGDGTRTSACERSA